MIYLLIFVSCLLVISAIGNLYQYHHFKAFKLKLKNEPGFETQLVLGDIFQGGTLLRIERVAPEDVFLRRP